MKDGNQFGENKNYTNHLGIHEKVQKKMLKIRTMREITEQILKYCKYF